jgi:hypothetical protein
LTRHICSVPYVCSVAMRGRSTWVR